MLITHAQFIKSLKADGVTEKSFTIMDPTGQEAATHQIDISITNAQASGSQAEQSGFMVQVVYSNAPSTILYTEVFPTQEVAQKVYDDLSNVAAECEGLIKQEKFDEAQVKTQDFLNKAKANSGDKPTQQAANAPVE